MTGQLTTPAAPAPTVPIPRRMARLPRDRHGRVVPWFVAVVDGVPDHRLIREQGITEAIRLNICFLCGQGMGAFKSFVIGPMCTVNRVSAEPPQHRDCATYAAQGCPFLTHPNMRRRPDLPEGTVAPDGEMCTRNPGVCAVWTTRSFALKPGMQLFDLGEPTGVTWWREGRPATYTEALDALVSGMEILGEAAAKDVDPAAAAESLEAQYWVATGYLPGNMR
jgi:hypothetical protein